MRDGTSYSGKVVSSSPTQMTLAGDDGVTRTIQMAQVQGVDYGSAPAAPPSAPPAASTTPPASGPPAAPPTDPTEPSAAPEPVHPTHEHPAESAVTTRTYVVPTGTRLPVRTEETIDSAKAVEGQTFAAEITRAVKDSSGDVVIPRGANAKIIIRSASKGGKFRGTSDLVLDLDSVSIDGRRYRLETVDLAQKGREGLGANKRTAEFSGGGAAVGAIIGAIAGGGKGAGIGALSGAGAGAAGQILTKGGSVKVPAETILTFQLERPLHVTTTK